jgi:hypothetical protein
MPEITAAAPAPKSTDGSRSSRSESPTSETQTRNSA